MKVLSHRGYWTSPSEKNTVPAFARSFALGFGTETDVRDSQGELVIAHDMPRGGEMTLAAFLHLASRRRLPLALNIKAGGLAHSLAAQMRGYAGEWFVFDMSVPDLRAHLAAGNPVFTRLSDLEPHPALYLMSYLNPLLAFGPATLARAAAAAGPRAAPARRRTRRAARESRRARWAAW